MYNPFWCVNAVAVKITKVSQHAFSSSGTAILWVSTQNSDDSLYDENVQYASIFPACLESARKETKTWLLALAAGENVLSGVSILHLFNNQTNID